MRESARENGKEEMSVLNYKTARDESHVLPGIYGALARDFPHFVGNAVIFSDGRDDWAEHDITRFDLCEVTERGEVIFDPELIRLEAGVDIVVRSRAFGPPDDFACRVVGVVDGDGKEDVSPCELVAVVKVFKK